MKLHLFLLSLSPSHYPLDNFLLSLNLNRNALSLYQPLNYRDCAISLSLYQPLTYRNFSLSLYLYQPLTYHDCALSLSIYQPLTCQDCALSLSLYQPLTYHNCALSLSLYQQLTYRDCALSLSLYQSLSWVLGQTPRFSNPVATQHPSALSYIPTPTTLCVHIIIILSDICKV